MTEAARAFAPRRHRVVVVDDRTDVRLLLQTRLGLIPDLELVGEGVNGAEAIERVRETSPDAIVLDLQMPVMTGAEAIPIIRAIAPHVRVLLYSAHAEAHDLRGAARPDAVVSKGANLKSLVDELMRLVSEKPSDILLLNLGELPLEEGIAAFDTWVGLNVRIREAIIAGQRLPGPVQELETDDVLALAGILLRLGEQLTRAAQLRSSSVELSFETRRDVGQAAARALRSISSTTSLEAFEESWEYVTDERATKVLRLVEEKLSRQLP